MSDFDKEAEREKLREKYGDESDERAATRQMSELLLKGATMTNKHCDTCGDPVFRYDGQEFCPTCQGQDGTYGGDRATEAEAAGTETAAEPAATTTESGADDTGTDTTGGERPVEVDTPDRAAASSEPTTGGERANADGRPASETGRRRESTTPAARERASPSRERRPAPVTDEGGDDLRAGQQSLERALARFARAAAESDDPRAAREHLAAAREAAEALSALRR